MTTPNPAEFPQTPIFPVIAEAVAAEASGARRPASTEELYEKVVAASRNGSALVASVLSEANHMDEQSIAPRDAFIRGAGHIIRLLGDQQRHDAAVYELLTRWTEDHPELTGLLSHGE